MTPDTCPLFPTYGEERLVLLPRDPWWLFAYWELGRSGPGELRLLFEETGELALSVPCDLGSRRFYLKAPHPGRRYIGVLGLKPQLDAFQPLLRSSAVELPHGQAADRGQPAPSSFELLAKRR